MKKSLLICFLIFVAAFAHAQIINPVKWTYSAKKIADKTYEIHITAVIDDKWHIYAQDAGEGPVPTSFVFAKNPLVTTIDKVKEIGKLEKAYDENFRSELKYYEKKVDFVQKIKLKAAASTTVKGTLTFMVCNDRQCLPPKDIPFSVTVGGK
ncbi:protein-disulfide reductase DsbD domain-containing protein [Ferruginibacter albus]|uniref:protein-disulfide reductase DsbD domain-containing protein n=1 Tax=Ferruginibacter albus TaxID=2875540 RepID=UPI001CC3BBBD|nr:protein-disulfide reductase DsbD domain-containing protein [Ferruginibacter albus]UAY52467.1 protein-disulfide reductase DsbD N-terminal domain-containing protein [Ferruginibacter albus]